MAKSRESLEKDVLVPEADRVAQTIPEEENGSRNKLSDALPDFKLDDDQIQGLLEDREEAAFRVYDTIDRLSADLDDFFRNAPEILPASLEGRLINADGRPAASVWVEAVEPSDSTSRSFPGKRGITTQAPWLRSRTMTDARGAFELPLPRWAVPESGLRLMVRGADDVAYVAVKHADLATGAGSLGDQTLDGVLLPAARTVLDRVVVPTSAEDVALHPDEFCDPPPVVTLGGEDCGGCGETGGCGCESCGECAKYFHSNTGVIDTYGFAILCRLVAPEMSEPHVSATVRDAHGRGIPHDAEVPALGGGVPTQYDLVKRIPIETPIDVDAFRRKTQTDPKGVHKGCSLGLGYIVRMHQTWIPTGLSLGDLVYSLPLAPGEQQRLAVTEGRETLSVYEAEALSVEEQQQYQEAADSSTSAVFRSAFNEAAHGSSSMVSGSVQTSVSASAGIGGVFGGFLLGGGVSSGFSAAVAAGTTSNSQSASRDYVSNAAQDFHSQLARQASGRRQANRTSMRLASSTDDRRTTAKVVSNHNHCHALTMQWWQVLRHFTVKTRVDDCQLVCYVPLEIVRFLPPNQPLALTSLPSGTSARASLLARYGALLQYHDVLERRFSRRPELTYGLRVLRSFAGNPTMTVDSATGSAQDVVETQLEGTFLPFEEVHVTAVSKTGMRVGPIRMNAVSTSAIPTGFESRGALIEYLRSRRRDQSVTLKAAIVLPDQVARTDLARLEFSRRFTAYSQRMSVPAVFAGLTGLSAPHFLSFMSQLDVTLSPSELEEELGGPRVADPIARIGTTDVVEAYFGAGGDEVMGAVLPVAAKRLAPLLRFADLLKIEAVLQHVVQNTVAYSQAVWESLTPAERAIMLESYTIGVPRSGGNSASEQVPLLDCVANEVLGYFGNAAVMPFYIPPSLATNINKTSRDIQEALLRFHREGFTRCCTTITLPTRGVLGEAVMGSCTSCEKIDLTRFWNWQDSPPDTATEPVIAARSLDAATVAAAPNTASTGAVVTINSAAAPTPPATPLVTALMGQLPTGTTSTDPTGLTALGTQMTGQTSTAAANFKLAMEQSQALAKEAMKALPEALKAANPSPVAPPVTAPTGTGTTAPSEPSVTPVPDVN